MKIISLLIALNILAIFVEALLLLSGADPMWIAAIATSVCAILVLIPTGSHLIEMNEQARVASEVANIEFEEIPF